MSQKIFEDLSGITRTNLGPNAFSNITNVSVKVNRKIFLVINFLSICHFLYLDAYIYFFLLVFIAAICIF